MSELQKAGTSGRLRTEIHEIKADLESLTDLISAAEKMLDDDSEVSRKAADAFIEPARRDANDIVERLDFMRTQTD